MTRFGAVVRLRVSGDYLQTAAIVRGGRVVSAVNDPNDYRGPVWKNPGRYLLPDSGGRVFGDPLPWRDLRDGVLSRGWIDLDNAAGDLKVRDQSIAFVGTDDPHLGLDRYADVPYRAPQDGVLHVGVTHAPYLRVVDAMVLL